MFGRRFFWFLLGVGVGLWVGQWMRRRLKKTFRQDAVKDRIRSISDDVRSAILESREAIRNNGH